MWHVIALLEIVSYQIFIYACSVVSDFCADDFILHSDIRRGGRFDNAQCSNYATNISLYEKPTPKKYEISISI